MFPNDYFCFAWRYFPASGLRLREDGRLVNISTEGDSWSSSSRDGASVQGAKLYFTTTNVNPLGYTYRAYCYPVRCVQELTWPFYIIRNIL